MEREKELKNNFKKKINDIKSFLIDDENKENNNSRKINKYIRKLKNNSNDKIELKNNTINEKLNSLYNIIISTQKIEEKDKQMIVNESEKSENETKKLSEKKSNSKRKRAKNRR